MNRLITVGFAFAGLLLCIAMVGGGSGDGSEMDSRLVSRAAPGVDPDRQRVEDHLARVSEQLWSRTTSESSTGRWKARETTLRWLDEYREAGVFPHNHVAPGIRTPVFVDPHGTPCAVGYLLLRSGEDELVEEIVRSDNLVRVAELRGDARFERWLESRGITLEEAAMIQPTYGPRPPDIGSEQTSHYVPATVGLSIASAALVSYNAMVGGNAGAPLVDGLLLGAAVGHVYLLTADDSGNHHTSAALNALGALVTVGTELVRLFEGDDDRAPERGLSAAIGPGVNGMELGVLIRH